MKLLVAAQELVDKGGHVLDSDIAVAVHVGMIGIDRTVISA